MGQQLAARQIVMHPFVLGEVALGSLRSRSAILADLRKIANLPVASPGELLTFIDAHALQGTGIGYVDTHIFASTLLAPGTRLWTRDKQLHAAAERLGVAARVVN